MMEEHNEPDPMDQDTAAGSSEGKNEVIADETLSAQNHTEIESNSVTPNIDEPLAATVEIEIVENEEETMAIESASEEELKKLDKKALKKLKNIRSKIKEKEKKAKEKQKEKAKEKAKKARRKEKEKAAKKKAADKKKKSKKK